MCKTKREDYEKYWDSISPFIKFGCLKDEKFCDKMKDAVLFKDIDGKYLTLKDCVEANGGELKELDKKCGTRQCRGKCRREEDNYLLCNR